MIASKPFHPDLTVVAWPISITSQPACDKLPDRSLRQRVSRLLRFLLLCMRLPRHNGSRARAICKTRQIHNACQHTATPSCRRGAARCTLHLLASRYPTNLRGTPIVSFVTPSSLLCCTGQSFHLGGVIAQFPSVHSPPSAPPKGQPSCVSDM